MTLVRNSNWPTVGGSLLPEFFDDDRFYNSPWLRGQSLPAVNVKESEKMYEIELAAPGFKKKDFTVSIDNGLLTVSAENRHEKEEKENSYTRREFGYNSFSRSFNLPANTSEENVQAQYEEGILKLSIAKKSLAQGKAKKPIEIR